MATREQREAERWKNAGAKTTIRDASGKVVRPVGAPMPADPSKVYPEPVRRPVVMPPSVTHQPQLQANYTDWEREQGAANDWYEQWQRGTLETEQNDLNNWETNVQGQINKMPDIYKQQSDMRAGNTAGLRSAFDGYNQSDLAATDKFIADNDANLGVFNQRYNDLYNTSVGPLTASQWSSNPGDLANQNQALGQFSNIYGGGLDYQAAQAQAKLAELYQYASDPTDVARQEAAIQELHGLINGGEWNDQLREVTDKYKGLSDPEITAQERFIMEQFNQQRQDHDRVNREAVMSDLSARGLRSGAAEQTAMLNSQQEMGRQGVLAALGAQGNAIERSQQAMQGWSQASQAGRAAQLQAQGMYVDAAGQLRSMNDQVGMFNTGEANATSRYNAGLQTQTNQFNAGQTNNARANNQATRLAGAQGYADQSNAIRSANDLVGTFNVGQQNLVGMNNQDVALRDLDRKAGLAQGQLFNQTSTGQVSLDARKSTNFGNAARDATIHGAQERDIDSWAGGMLAPIGTQIGFEDQKLANRGSLSGTTRQVGSDLWGGVFTPTIAGKKLEKDKLIGNDFRMMYG